MTKVKLCKAVNIDSREFPAHQHVIWCYADVICYTRKLQQIKLREGYFILEYCVSKQQRLIPFNHITLNLKNTPPLCFPSFHQSMLATYALVILCMLASLSQLIYSAEKYLNALRYQKKSFIILLQIFQNLFVIMMKVRHLINIINCIIPFIPIVSHTLWFYRRSKLCL